MTLNSNTIIVSFSGDPMITSSLKGKWPSTIIFFLILHIPYRRVHERTSDAMFVLPLKLKTTIRRVAPFCMRFISYVIRPRFLYSTIFS